MAYEPRYENSTKQEIILGLQFHDLALKALVKNHQTNIFETKIIAYHESTFPWSNKNSIHV